MQLIFSFGVGKVNMLRCEHLLACLLQRQEATMQQASWPYLPDWMPFSENLCLESSDVVKWLPMAYIWYCVSALSIMYLYIRPAAGSVAESFTCLSYGIAIRPLNVRRVQIDSHWMWWDSCQSTYAKYVGYHTLSCQNGVSQFCIDQLVSTWIGLLVL